MPAFECYWHDAEDTVIWHYIVDADNLVIAIQMVDQAIASVPASVGIRAELWRDGKWVWTGPEIQRGARRRKLQMSRESGISTSAATASRPIEARRNPPPLSRVLSLLRCKRA